MITSEENLSDYSFTKEQSCNLHPDLQTVDQQPATITSNKTEMPPTDQLLDPDNPLLIKFQQTLKQHLLQHIKRLNEEIFEYESDFKKTESLKEELGVQVYNEQQTLQKQQKTIENLMEQLKTTQAAREETETRLKDNKQIYKNEHERVLKAENEEKELCRKIENFDYLNHKLTQWENSLESDLTIKQRIIEKTEKEKLQLLDEKRLQDQLIYKLMHRIWLIEQQLEQLDVQIKLKTDERDEMAEIIFYGNIQIEQIQSEYRAILHQWNSLITTITTRNKTINTLKDIELRKIEDKLKTIRNQFEQIRKSIKKEMETNEKLTIFNQQIIKSINNTETIIKREKEKRNLIELEMQQMQMIIEQIENDIKTITNQIKHNEVNHAALLKLLEKLQIEKNQLDEQILKLLENRMCNDQATINLNRRLRELRENNRLNELNLLQLENRTIQLQTNNEIQRNNNEELMKYLKDVEHKYNETLRITQEFDDILQHNQRLLTKKQRDFEILSTKLFKLLEKTGGEILSPIDLKIKDYEGQICIVNDEMKELQSCWLREQVNVLQLSKDRQAQVQKINLLNKQIMLMEQKNLRITDDIENYLKKQQQLQRNINLLHQRLINLNENIFKKNDTKTDLNQMNEFLRKDYLLKLETAEYECLQLQDNIQQINMKIKQFNYDLLQMNREILEWEKQYQLVKELKTNFQQEKSVAGEIGGMRAEIHRMSVRYTQLKRAQDKLIHDLEHCVYRRDAIITTAEAREKRSKDGLEKTRINFQRKLDNMKNQIKQMQNEIKINDEQQTKLVIEKLQLLDNLQNLNNELDVKKQQIDRLTVQIEEIAIKCQLNFELLLQLQKKLTMYNDLLNGKRIMLLFRTRSGLIEEQSKQNEFNTNLLQMIDDLIQQFPHLQQSLKRIMNTLKIPSFFK